MVGSLSLSQEIFVLPLAALVGPKYFFLTVHYFNSFVPVAQQAGQSAMLGRLSLSIGGFIKDEYYS
jgi:hypothetical protein